MWVFSRECCMYRGGDFCSSINHTFFLLVLSSEAGAGPVQQGVNIHWMQAHTDMQEIGGVSQHPRWMVPSPFKYLFFFPNLGPQILSERVHIPANHWLASSHSPPPPDMKLEIKNITTPMFPQDNQRYFWWRIVQCVFVCTCGGGGWCNWEAAAAEEESVYVYIHRRVCLRALMCVLERGPAPRHLFFCRVLWCHPPTSPLCFHTSVSHGAPALFVGRCACVHAEPKGRYFEVEFCLCLCLFKHILKEFSVSSCTLQREAGIARIIVQRSFDRQLRC